MINRTRTSIMAAIGVGAMLVASQAFAHAHLVSSTPAANAALPTAPKTITLTFNEKLVPAFSKFELSMVDHDMKVPVTTAVSKDGSRKLAGMTWAKPPDPRLLIRISEDFVSPATPEPPASPGAPRPTATSELPAPSWPDAPAVAGGSPNTPGFGTFAPPSGGSLQRAVELGTPVPRPAGAPAPVPAPAPPRPENVVTDNRTWPPAAVWSTRC